ncbi:MAG: efflux RND transporter periplasmic adaptor subunit [Pirellulales bacterium]
MQKNLITPGAAAVSARAFLPLLIGLAALTIAGLAALTMVGLAGCDYAASEAATGAAADQAALVEVATVRSADLREVVNLTGNVDGYETVQLMGRVEGYIDKVNVDIGDEVAESDVLATVAAPELLAAVAESRALVKQAQADLASKKAEFEEAKATVEEFEAQRRLRQAEYQRITALVEDGSLKGQLRDEARYALESSVASLRRAAAQVDTAQAHVLSTEARIGTAEAAREKAEAMQSFTVIRAPFAGVVTGRMIDRGTFVRPASAGSAKPLFSLVRNNKLRLVVWLTMDAAGKLNVGDPVVFRGPSGNPIEGRISRYAVAFNEGSRKMRAEVDLDNPVDGSYGRRKLEPGVLGNVELTLDTRRDTPTVPAAALVSDDRGDCVMIVEQGRVRRCPVSVLRKDTVVWLASGAEPGETVVARAGERLTDGQKVEVRLSPSANGGQDE